MGTFSDAKRDAKDFAKLVNEDTDVDTRYGGVKPSYIKKLNQLAANFNLTPAFDFDDGFIIETRNQAGLDSNGEYWIYNGELPFQVAAGTTPSEPDYKKVTFSEAQNVALSTGQSVQGFADSFALKIFQSPTDGDLTNIQTRTVDAGEVYEVRKTSDDSLATIYSDAAGNTEISQNGTDNKSGSDGVVEFYIVDGDYYVEADGLESNFNVPKIKIGVPSKDDYQLRNIEYGGLNLNGEESVSILGDSISWGQGSVDIRNDSYVGILTKALNYEYDGEYPGFIPLVLGVSDSWDHQISVTGSWSGVSLGSASHIMNGYGRTTTSGTARITITAPTSISPKCDIWWTRQPTGGTFGIYVNDSLVTTVNTLGGTSKSGWFSSKGIPLNDGGDGECEVSIRPNGDGDVEICGISYGDGSNDFRVQNWSMPGRKARDLSTEVIDRAANGAKFLLFALGHNDQNATGSDLTEALDNIEYVKNACEQYGTKLVVLDLIWDKDYTNDVKRKLKEIGEYTEGATYIEFSRSLATSGELKTSTQLIDQGFLIDSSHPSPDGHKTIAESVAKNIFLGMSSKFAIERLELAETSVQESSVQDFSVTATNATITSSVASYKIVDGVATVIFRARLTGISASSDVIITLPSEISPSEKYYTGSGVEGQLIPCGIIDIGGAGVTSAIAQFTSSTTIRIRNSAGIGENSDVHAAITYVLA